MTVVKGNITSTFVKDTKVLLHSLQQILKSQGNKGLCLYLKVCSVAMQQSLSGYNLKNISTISGPRIRRTRSGLPRIIPRNSRLIINKFSTTSFIYMRYYLSIFYLYRCIYFRPNGSLKSIINPIRNPNWYIKDLKFYIEIFLSLFIPMKYLQDPFSWLRKLGGNNPHIQSASAGRATGGSDNDDFSLFGTHPATLYNNIIALKFKENKTLRSAIFYFLDIVELFHLRNWFKPRINRSFYAVPGKLDLGKLSFKEEPAGKLRIFAMVDAITNWCLLSLHKYLFKILGSSPCDGTFDQLRPINRLLRRKSKGLYSLDLSSATDRLPIQLQKSILESLFNKEFSDYWSTLMIGRKYTVNPPYELQNKDLYRTKVSYSVGQPMGALSSWAMLAFCHHFIVQLSAWKSGFPISRLYKNYAILGDDVVIGDYKVKTEYLKIINILGMDVSLHKSIQSSKSKGIEFAKKTIIKNKDGKIFDISPVSFKEISSAFRRVGDLLAFKNKYNLSDSELLFFLGYGYKVSGSLNKSYWKLSRVQRLIIFSNFTKINYSEIFTTVPGLKKTINKFPTESMIKFFSEEIHRLLNKLDYVIIEARMLRDLSLEQFRGYYYKSMLRFWGNPDIKPFDDNNQPYQSITKSEYNLGIYRPSASGMWILDKDKNYVFREFQWFNQITVLDSIPYIKESKPRIISKTKKLGENIISNSMIKILYLIWKDTNQSDLHRISKTHKRALIALDHIRDQLERLNWREDVPLQEVLDIYFKVSNIVSQTSLDVHEINLRTKGESKYPWRDKIMLNFFRMISALTSEKKVKKGSFLLPFVFLLNFDIWDFNLIVIHNLDELEVPIHILNLTILIVIFSSMYGFWVWDLIIRRSMRIYFYPIFIEFWILIIYWLNQTHQSFNDSLASFNDNFNSTHHIYDELELENLSKANEIEFHYCAKIVIGILFAFQISYCLYLFILGYNMISDYELYQLTNYLEFADKDHIQSTLLIESIDDELSFLENVYSNLQITSNSFENLSNPADWIPILEPSPKLEVLQIS